MYIISSNSACRTYFFALTAANTLRMVGSFGRINLHLADLCAGAALGTLIFIYPVFEHGNRIKNRIDGTQRTDIFAKRAINQDRTVKTVTARRTFFQTYSQPMALRIDLFRRTSGIPPSSVPAGQISLQKYGEP